MKFTIDTEDEETLLNEELTAVGDMIVASMQEYKDTCKYPAIPPEPLLEKAKDIQTAIREFVELVEEG